ncbi:helix-turn-helix domain-containing protein [Helcococcus bovis]|uniref:Rgg/GadR/MutR family transcriptional regulator n=1 Tax=Helcococcus bovis TaxID=3153252 RepID=UPI0038B7BC5F
MNNYGKVFQKIRKDKNYTLKQIASDEISVSQVSRFERGETDLSIGKFIFILNKIGITVDEFMIYARDYEKYEVVNMMSKVVKYHYEKNIDGFNELIVLNENKLKLNPDNIFYPLYIILFKGFICKINETKLSDDDLQKVVDHLFVTENWGILEIQLIGNLYEFFSTKRMLYFFDEIFKNFEKYKKSSVHKHLVMITSLNIFLKLIERDDIKEAEKINEKLKEIVGGETKVYERMILKYSEAFLLYKKGDSAGVEMMNKIIETFKLLNCDYHAKNYQEHFDKFVII